MCCFEVTLRPVDALDMPTGAHTDSIEDGALVNVSIPKSLFVVFPLFELPLVDSLLVMDRCALCGLFVVVVVVTHVSLSAADMFSDRRWQGETELSCFDLPVHVREVD